MTVERFSAGDPLLYATKGVDMLSSEQKRRDSDISDVLSEEYGTELSTETANVVEKLTNSIDMVELVDAARDAGLHEVEDWDAVFPEDIEQSLNTDSPGLSDAMSLMDQKLSDALLVRQSGSVDTDMLESVYIPELVGGDGTVFMAKTISSTAKVRMAWDLDDDNQVVLVDEYEIWDRLLGWERLKQFPYGKNKIREEYGDKLSDDLLDMLLGGESSGDTETMATDGEGDAHGRRTRTKPSEEVLNLGLSRKHDERRKIKAEDIADVFDDDESVDISYDAVSDMIVLFPTSTDKLLSEHWWVAGEKPFGDGDVALANCNKGTFEYLNHYENVWHIEDYLSQAEDYEFTTTAGDVTMNTANVSDLVIHVLPEHVQKAFMRVGVFQNVIEQIHAYYDEKKYRSPSLPHEDDMMYAPISKADAFWLRPVLREHASGDGEGALVLSGSSSISKSVNGLDAPYRLSSHYSLYARARLNEWDYDMIELDTLEDCSGLYFDLDEGGIEIVETLAKLHDAGEMPFSVSPESRWSA
jgi:hypothetical protein